MHVERVELRCSDVEASAAFYARLVGLEIAALDPERARLRAPDASADLLVLRRAGRPGEAPRRASGLFHTAFRYPRRAGLGAALRRAADEIHHPLTGASDHGVSEALYLDDPDGLGVELYRDRPREQWPQPEPDERVRMYTEPLDLAGVAGADDGAAPAVAAAGVDIGHVHLKVADLEAAVEFWTDRIGLELMTRFGSQAAFLADGGYHHHIGANTWFSAGAAAEPPQGAGLDRVALAVDGEGGSERTPDGLAVALVPPDR